MSTVKTQQVREERQKEKYKDDGSSGGQSIFMSPVFLVFHTIEYFIL